MLLTGPISHIKQQQQHRQKQYIDFAQRFTALLDMPHINFSVLMGTEL